MDTNSQLPLLDRLKAATERQRADLARAGAGVTSAATSGTAMLFKVGDRVIDTATGQRGKVRAAEPRARGGWLYALDLDDGRVVMRGGDELRADAPPTGV